MTPGANPPVRAMARAVDFLNPCAAKVAAAARRMFSRTDDEISAGGTGVMGISLWVRGNDLEHPFRLGAGPPWVSPHTQSRIAGLDL
ncbi:hypothetical protein GCM10022223_51620 [Kineosporia mesophila]|uniref:Uncharacterized protein n=1 Tax=Kineosporia mesophila TaxID=566012 RepID=A0ABP7AAC5_9ACTN